MGLDLSILDVERAEPDRSRGWSELLGIAHRALVTQLAMGSKLIVFAPEVFDDHACFGQGP